MLTESRDADGANTSRSGAMSKLILASAVIAMFVVPIQASKEKNSRKGLNKVVIQMLVLEVLYLLALRFLWGRV